MCYLFLAASDMTIVQAVASVISSGLRAGAGANVLGLY